MSDPMVVNLLHERIRRVMWRHWNDTGDDWALHVLADIPGWIARTGAPGFQRVLDEDEKVR
jgi:hypothetical protein